MLRSLFSAVSGMQAHQTKLDVIGNNIANVNTYGLSQAGHVSRMYITRHCRALQAVITIRAVPMPAR